MVIKVNQKPDPAYEKLRAAKSKHGDATTPAKLKTLVGDVLDSQGDILARLQKVELELGLRR